VQWTLWMLIVGLSILPLIKTVNELMTWIVLRTKAYMLIEQLVVPPMARMIGSILRFVFGVETIVNGGSIFLLTGGLPYKLYLSWNCIGWQSLVLLLFSLTTGLQGRHSLGSKLKCIALGLEGIVAVNLLRIVTTAMLLLRWGYAPAITFHDRLSLLVTFAWLAAFWFVSNEFILEPSTQAKRPFSERLRESMRNLRLRSLLPDFVYGRRAMGLATMAIILTMTALGGVAALSAKVPSGANPTTLSFEHLDGNVTVCGINTSRIMTHPAYTDLGASAYADPHVGGYGIHWTEMWNFYLYGPLQQSYALSGSNTYSVWLHISFQGHISFTTYIRFYVYDVDETGVSTQVACDTFRITLTNTPRNFNFTSSSISHVFPAGHTIRVRIDILDGLRQTYVLEYDSPDRHSYVDLPGIVVQENITHLMYLAIVIPPLTSALRKRKRPARGTYEMTRHSAPHF